MIFEITSPLGKKFSAKIEFGAEGPVVVSNRNGKWEPEEQLQVADLIMPEYNFADWDIKEIKVDSK
jgi:hypothetical protein